MNIYIYKCANTYNYGSMMMGENFISKFNEITGEKHNYYVEAYEEENVERLKEATNIEEIYPVKMNHLFKEGTEKYDFIYGYLGLKNIIADSINDFDLAIVLGGDDFSEDYGWIGAVINAFKYNALRKAGMKVVMVGQSIGPFYSFRKPLMKFLLSRLEKIYTRETITYYSLINKGFRNVESSDDLALLPLARQSIDEVRTQEYISFFPSELIYRYSKEDGRQEWVEFNLFMAKRILEKYPTKKLVIIPHVVKPQHSDDRIIAREFYDLLEEKYKDRIIFKNHEMLPYEVRNYIQDSYITISSRMHPVISSIQCEIPSIAISYSTKYWGIIGERYGLYNSIIDIRYLNYEEMKERFLQNLEKIDTEYEQIQNKMSQKSQVVTERIYKSLLEIESLTKK